MSIIARLLHLRAQPEPDAPSEPAPPPESARAPEPAPPPTTPASDTGPRERDNRGTRHDTLDKASAYWVARMADPHKDPFVLYTFDREDDARAALLALPCIEVAADTGDLISTDVLIFGYYPAAPGTFEAIICGRDLSHELWVQARESFARHGGRRKNDLEPELVTPPATPAAPVAGDASKVQFDGEERIEQAGVTFVYRIHRGPDAASAKAFLEQHPVTERNTYVLVNTPEGTWGRDIDGMYRQ